MRPFGGEQAEAFAAEMREKTQRLSDFIKSVAVDYRRTHNLPVDDDGRLIPGAHEDAGRTTEGMRQWHGDVADATRVWKDSESEGERLEMLAYAVFWKNLREKFIVARASRHDGDINKVHTVLLEKETGALVCAFDEVSDTSGVDYDRKMEAVRKQNVEEGGTTLKYGLRVEARGDKKAVVSGIATNIPLFYIALPKDRVDKGIREFAPSPEKQSEFEKKLFEYFIKTILSQISALELYSNRMEHALRERLKRFENAIEKFRTEQSGP